MKSRRRRDSTLARTSRAVVVQPKRATISTIRPMLPPAPWPNAAGRPSLAGSTAASTISTRKQRQRDHGVGDPHQEGIEPAAGIACHETDRGTDQRREEGADHADGQGDPAGVEEPQEHVAPQLVRPQGMGSTRRLEAGQQVHGLGVEAEHAADERCCHGREGDSGQEQSCLPRPARDRCRPAQRA